MYWNGPLQKIKDFRFEIPSSYQGEQKNLHMKTSAVIYVNNGMIESIRKDNALEQAANVTMLPGIVGKSLAMPDIHWGYGFPIGGVAAMDEENGVISPGGVGYDINCGVRLMRTNLHFTDLDPQKIQRLVDEMFFNVPSGLGSKAKVHLNKKQLDEVLKLGAKWAIENGYGWKDELGSLGAGNHFLEIQKVAEIYDPVAANAFGIHNEGQIMVMIHTGSRGFGHQVCTDHLRVLEQAVKKYNIWLPDRQLACAPVTSNEGQDYLKAMACAANFAWCNRQMIVHWVRESFEKVLRQRAEDLDMGIVYDVCHNIAKLEEHDIEGRKRKVYVHRKGATRSFGPGKREVPLKYRDIGQPVIIPGDMGTESYLLRGTKESEETFGSTCHGAGRVMSRAEAVHRYRGEQIMNDLKMKGIYAHPASWKVMAEEAPDAYKDVSEVVNVTHGAGISLKVAKLLPLGVVKG